ncbi:MAG: IS200/IS605 family element transposase accessory protein TnpB [Microcystis aeruginosa W13-15]|nr:IS200/IS605 family element transposase accessory protein TnpB [Microcystis aeruginosa W13-16]NCQ74400.1 IS200/IS605 family element transposase accessory protein TnpB [Microcystis aeruginosa W13-13]NCQ78912.1 IS200/IS605 family element transposase accessory protein TnpB [Microcystis aeruginosa W13-15]NCS44688.1 IS200/IS605 family element transposase accessory protein TnpB [Microcystis aeruginosa BS11-05]NCS53271.1 IS200/IS605 family element transposase accessory protein TnpB [Microcystis aeru
MEFKLKVKPHQEIAIQEAIRIGQFIRNKCLRFWMDSTKEDKVNYATLCRFVTNLTQNLEFPFAGKLNSMARQASAQRAWFSISRFYDNCQKGLAKKGYPKFKKFSRSVEYKSSGWKLTEDKKFIHITDKTGIGKLKLIGTFNRQLLDKTTIKRVRLIRRADGFYCQFVLDIERKEPLDSTGKEVGIDLGLNHFLTDSNGDKIDNPRFLRKSEKRLKKAQRKLSKKKKGSQKRLKQKSKVARLHLKVSRQRKDFAVKTAKALIQSNDLVVYEDLKVSNMVKNPKLAKSISDASWSMFTDWLGYFGKIHGKFVVAVNPRYTSQQCSSCGNIVKKTLSVRTHICSCGCVLDRDENAAINILHKANTVGRTGIQALGQTTHCLLGESLINKVTG